jgi:tRNA dimethylallyltransferase
MPDSRSDTQIFQSPSADALFATLCDRVQASEQAIPVITGPTAAGKSALAIKLAQAIGGEIVSCDAMQVYQGFDIGTAKPTPEDLMMIPHHMIDILDPCDSISVASFVDDVTQLLTSLLAQGKYPILCGGSVQYVSALLDGLQFFEAQPDSCLRETVAREIDAKGVQESWEILEQLDPEAAIRIAPTDRRRICRFFELYHQTGMTKTEHNRRSREQGPQFAFKTFWIDLTPRSSLYERIDRRVEQMYDEGLTEETRLLMEQYPQYNDCPAFRGIGYRECVQLVQGVITEQEARIMTARSTRRYAKRQQTWLRRRDDLFVLLLDRTSSDQVNQ